MFNLNNIIKSKTGVVLGALLMCFSISVFVMAWTDPTCDPSVDPSLCNAPAPINSITPDQTITGNLNITSTGADALTIHDGGDLKIISPDGNNSVLLYVDNGKGLTIDGDLEVSGGITLGGDKIMTWPTGGGDQNLASVLTQGSDASSFTGITKFGGNLIVKNYSDNNGKIEIGNSDGVDAEFCLNGECFNKADFLIAAGGGGVGGCFQARSVSTHEGSCYQISCSCPDGYTKSGESCGVVAHDGYYNDYLYAQFCWCCVSPAVDCDTCYEWNPVTLSCEPVVAGSDPENDCPNGVCTTGLCDGVGSCQYTASGQEDGCSACKHCDGSGICVNMPDSQEDVDGSNKCELCKDCQSGSCVNIATGSDPYNSCSVGSCGTGLCNGSGNCQYTSAGEESTCSVCKQCSGSSSDCANISSGSKDTAGSNLCIDTHYRCNGGGSCTAPLTDFSGCYGTGWECNQSFCSNLSGHGSSWWVGPCKKCEGSNCNGTCSDFPMGTYMNESNHCLYGGCREYTYDTND